MQKLTGKYARKPKAARLGHSRLTLLAIAAALGFACSDPRLVILDFQATAAPTLSADSAEAPYSWSFTATSELAGSKGLPVLARLYKRLSLVNGIETRILAAEAALALPTAEANGSRTALFSATLAPGYAYYVEFAFVDDLGPKVVTSAAVNL